jgi:hypothetical protein
VQDKDASNRNLHLFAFHHSLWALWKCCNHQLACLDGFQKVDVAPRMETTQGYMIAQPWGSLEIVTIVGDNWRSEDSWSASSYNSWSAGGENSMNTRAHSLLASWKGRR